ncbi:MAG: hypothetical protein V1831_01950 [Candidatus Woesearchaeota archaeon]
MVIRQISKEKYIVAGLITGGIFLLGVLFGLVIEGKRLGYVDDVSKEQNLDFSSLQLQYAFIDQLSQEKNCEGVSNTFEENVGNLEITRERLETFDQDAKLNKKEFDTLKREYVLAQIRFWLLAKRTKELCGNEMVTILYFLSDNKECPNCDNQAFVLTYLKKIFKEKLLIFSFDSKFNQEPMISILKNTYEITNYPTIVIESEKYEGLTNKEDILKIICPYYSTEIDECTGLK